jgi:hypothetical protein
MAPGPAAAPAPRHRRGAARRRRAPRHRPTVARHSPAYRWAQVSRKPPARPRRDRQAEAARRRPAPAAHTAQDRVPSRPWAPHCNTGRLGWASSPPFFPRCRAVRFHVRGVDHLHVGGSSVPSKCPAPLLRPPTLGVGASSLADPAPSSFPKKVDACGTDATTLIELAYYSARQR